MLLHPLYYELQRYKAESPIEDWPDDRADMDAEGEPCANCGCEECACCIDCGSPWCPDGCVGYY